MGNKKLSMNKSKCYLQTKGALKIQEIMMNWKISGAKVISSQTHQLKKDFILICEQGLVFRILPISDDILSGWFKKILF